MLVTDEEALICDLAETYNIYNYRELPLKMVALFSCGLRDDSRIKMKLSGQVVPLEAMLLAGISDKVNTLIWFQTKDGQKGKNRPPSMVGTLTNSSRIKEDENDFVVFDSGEDFENVRQKLIKSGGV